MPIRDTRYNQAGVKNLSWEEFVTLLDVLRFGEMSNVEDRDVTWKPFHTRQTANVAVKSDIAGYWFRFTVPLTKTAWETAHKFMEEQGYVV